jgi:ariadne-1
MQSQHLSPCKRATTTFPHRSSQISLLAGVQAYIKPIMSSDYEFDDDDGDYYDSDEDMIDGTQDGRTITKFLRYSSTDVTNTEQSEDEDMEAFVPPKSKRKPYEIDYESLSQSAVENLMQEDIDHICGILGVEVSGVPIVSS